MFQFGRYRFRTYVFSLDSEGLNLTGLPHSEILRVNAFSSSPKLFAGIRVLHRLLMPRHPPAALNSLTKKNLITSYKLMSYLIT